MTFEEYKNQANPVYMPNVVITREDCKTIKSAGMNYEGDSVFVVVLEISGQDYTYNWVPRKGSMLFHYDKKGNRQTSCFNMAVTLQEVAK